MIRINATQIFISEQQPCPSTTHTHTHTLSTNWTISALIVSVNMQMEECADEKLSSLRHWLNIFVYHSQQSAEPQFFFFLPLRDTTDFLHQRQLILLPLNLPSATGHLKLLQLNI